jgi:hypothetical protein
MCKGRTTKERISKDRRKSVMAMPWSYESL